jgi:hypothetical protein
MRRKVVSRKAFQEKAFQEKAFQEKAFQIRPSSTLTLAHIPNTANDL